MGDYSALVVDLETLGPSICRLVLDCPAIAQAAEPGQFVLIRIGETWSPLLRRPLGILEASPQQGTFEVLFRSVGVGTALLAQVKIGQELSVRGPAGRGFAPPQHRRCWAVAGALGAVPLLFLRQRLGGFDRFLLGLSGASWEPFAQWMADRVPELELYSEDGTLGRRGVCLDGLGDQLEDLSLVACGPNAMMKALYDRWGQSCNDIQVSLERRMACGFGGCYGCSVATPSGRRRVCADGPVFQAQEVLWDEL